MEWYERTDSISPAGVGSDGMSAQGTIHNTGSPSGDRRMDQLAARERQAGPTGMAEGLVVRAEQRVVREGSSPSGARMRGAISKSGSNLSLAGEGSSTPEGRVSIARWNPKGMRRST